MPPYTLIYITLKNKYKNNKPNPKFLIKTQLK